MSRIALDSTPFNGRSRSVTYLRTAKRLGATCQHCGSSLAGRSEGVRKWGDRFVHVYRCGCKRRRLVEVAG